MRFVFKMMRFVLQMMRFAFKMMESGPAADGGTCFWLYNTNTPKIRPSNALILNTKNPYFSSDFAPAQSVALFGPPAKALAWPFALKSSFSMRNSLFLMRNSAFLLQNPAF